MSKEERERERVISISIRGSCPDLVYFRASVMGLWLRSQQIKDLKSNCYLSWILGEANSGHVTPPTGYNSDLGSSKSQLGTLKTHDMDDTLTEMSCNLRALALTLKKTVTIYTPKKERRNLQWQKISSTKIIMPLASNERVKICR